MLSNLHQSTNLTSDMSGKTTSSSKASATTTFANVGGLNPILQELQQVIAYGQCPARYQAVGARPPRGILLHGPPGTGKTLLARALAGQASTATQASLTPSSTTTALSGGGTIDSFTVCSASEFVEVYVGRGAARIRSLFENARTTALQNYQGKVRQCEQEQRRGYLWAAFQKHILGEDEPCSSTSATSSATLSALKQRKPTALIFIDELDAVAKQRDSGSSLFGGGSTNNDEREQTLNQLLTEMDGYNSHDGSEVNDNIPKDKDDVLVIVMAASNRAQILDPAVLRRFELQLAVPKPDHDGRREILEIHLQQHLTQQHGTASVDCTDFDCNKLATLSEGMTGSDLRTIVNDATLLALRQQEQQQLGRDQPVSNHPWSVQTPPDGAIRVTMDHLEQAIDRMQQTRKRTAAMNDDSMGNVAAVNAFLRQQRTFGTGSSSTNPSSPQPTPLRSNKSSRWDTF